MKPFLEDSSAFFLAGEVMVSFSIFLQSLISEALLAIPLPKNAKLQTRVVCFWMISTGLPREPWLGARRPAHVRAQACMNSLLPEII